MCIRDRTTTYEFTGWTLEDGSKVNVADLNDSTVVYASFDEKEKETEPTEPVGPVSYTHLDVYKRQFQDSVTGFYARFGVGNLGLHKAFRIQNTNGVVELATITRIAHVKLDDLVGYEIAKKKLVDNTEAFVKGKSANNCLLFGDAGTGKSTSIKAIANQYYEQGLRLIEVYKHQFKDLNTVISMIKNRNYKFIIYMDDLSFEEFEIEYKYLKAVIEGRCV